MISCLSVVSEWNGRPFIVHCTKLLFLVSRVDNLRLSNSDVHEMYYFHQLYINKPIERANTNVDMPKSNNEADAGCKPQTNIYAYNWVDSTNAHICDCWVFEIEKAILTKLDLLIRRTGEVFPCKFLLRANSTSHTSVRCSEIH